MSYPSPTIRHKHKHAQSRALGHIHVGPKAYHSSFDDDQLM